MAHMAGNSRCRVILPALPVQHLKTLDKQSTTSASIIDTLEYLGAFNTIICHTMIE